MKPFLTIYEARAFASIADGPVSMALFVPGVVALKLEPYNMRRTFWSASFEEAVPMSVTQPSTLYELFADRMEAVMGAHD